MITIHMVGFSMGGGDGRCGSIFAHMLIVAWLMARGIGSNALKHGSGATVLRRSEGTCLSSPNDDEVGGCQSAIRAERAAASGAIKQRR
jgi:hypothetical protein